MATNAENLAIRRAAICEELAAMDATKAGGLPDAPGNVGHVEYRLSLYRELEMIDKSLAAAEGAFEVTSEYFA